MADDKRTPPGAQERPSSERARKRRATPTIDLTATEVDPPKASPPPEPPKMETASQPSPEPKTEPSRAEAAKKPRVWTYAAAGVTGGIAIAEIAFAWWLSTSPQGGVDAATTARIAALESQFKVAQTQVQPAPPPRDTASSERLGAVENSLNALGVALAAFNKRSDEISSQIAGLRERVEVVVKAADTEALQARIASLENAAKAAAQERAKNAGADAAARAALAAASLRDAVLRGEPFAPRLAAMKSLSVEPQKLAPLEDFATTGVPSEPALARQLSGLIAKMAEAAGASTHTGFFEKLQANAGKLVRVRPVDAPAGDDAAAVLARIELAAASNNVASAQAEIAKLPEPARVIAAPWSRAVEARKAALAAAQALADDTALELGKP